MPESFLSEVKDNRRKEGKRYKPADIPLFSVSAIPGGAASYRKIHTFIGSPKNVVENKMRYIATQSFESKIPLRL